MPDVPPTVGDLIDLWRGRERTLHGAAGLVHQSNKHLSDLLEQSHYAYWQCANELEAAWKREAEDKTPSNRICARCEAVVVDDDFVKTFSNGRETTVTFFCSAGCRDTPKRY